MSERNWYISLGPGGLKVEERDVEQPPPVGSMYRGPGGHTVVVTAHCGAGAFMARLATPEELDNGQ